MTKRTIKRDFARSARRMKPDDPFDLEKEVADVYRDHPEIENDTYFYDLASRRLIHPRLTGEMQDKVLSEPEFKKLEKKFRKEKASYSAIGRERLPFNVVFLYLEKDSANLGVGPASYSEGQTKRALFDHELGHILTLRDPNDPVRHGSPLLKETMAENFALLRQYQRYGTRSKSVKGESRVDMSAAYYIFGGIANEDRQVNDHYFYSPSLESIVDLKKRFNVAALSPKETVGLARARALAHTPRESELDEMRTEFAMSAKEYILPTLAARVLTTKSQLAFKWGSRALDFVMGPDYKRHPDAEEFRRKYWPMTKRALMKKERQMAHAQP